MTTPEFSALRTRILAFIAKHPGEEFKQAVLARRLSITSKEEFRLLVDVLRDLHESGELRRGKQRRYGHAAAPRQRLTTGVFRRERNGNGSVQVEGPDRFTVVIPQRLSGTAISGDTVRVVPFGAPAGGEGDAARYVEGEVVEVVERSGRPIVGTFQKGKNFFFVVPDTRDIDRDIYIPKGKTLGARPGDKVVARVDAWESRNLNPEGHILELLGKAGEVSAEMASVAREFRLPLSFPAAVTSEAEAIPAEIPRAEIARRRDVRGLTTFTIDPEDAKDFDDALSLEPLDDGSVRAWVHIADVSHYVREGTHLDREAVKRGTSVYLANEVIPMLPEKLSNNICSLRPEEDRLAFSVMIHLSPKATTLAYEFHKTVIRSDRRFTYEEVHQVLSKGRGPFAKELGMMRDLSAILLKNRLRDGALDFETVEVKFRFDDEGHPTEIVKKTRLDAHRLVEEFMLLANRTVATHIARPRERDDLRPFVYRIHDVPPPEKLADFAAFVEHLGYALPIRSGSISKAIQSLLASVKGSDEENVVNEVAIRSMAKAEYSEKNIGHFGLAFEYYTHFTSPIRRYPDLIVHRLLAEYMVGMQHARRRQMLERLPDLCASSTERERVAQEAERASVRVMQLEYMKRHVGDQFQAIISGVVKFGLFVEINDLQVEGLIHVREMDDDFYYYDEKQFAFIGRSTKKRYRLGDTVTIQVVRVDPEEREIDFRFVTEGEPVAPRRTRRRHR